MKNNNPILRQIRLFSFSVFLLVMSNIAFAQTPTLIGQYVYSTKGQGAAGAPNFIYNIPAGKNRVMIVTTYFERDHPSLGANYPGSNADDTPSLRVGTIDVEDYYYNYRYFSQTNNVSSTSYISSSIFTYRMTDLQNLPTGNTNFSIPYISNTKLPQSAGDDVVVSVVVFENASQAEPSFASYIGNNYDAPTSSTSFSLLTQTAPPAPVGTLQSNIVYVAYGGITDESTLSNSAGWTDIHTGSSNNNLGQNYSASSNTGGYKPFNEPDGNSMKTIYRSGVTGNPSVNFARTSNVTILTYQGRMTPVLPLARPSIAGTVFNDTTGPATIQGSGTNAGGLFVNVIDANNNLVYSATVASNGTYTIPSGIVIESNVYRLEISTNTGTVGNPAPVKALPANWTTVGESSTGVSPYNSDGTNDGIINLTIGTVNLSEMRFGITTCAAGTAAANQTIVSGTSPSSLSLTGSSGAVQWQVSTDNVTFTNISGATGTAYAPGVLTATRYYRANVASGGCISNVVTITVTSNTFSCPGNNDLYLSQGPNTSTGTQFQLIGRNTNPFTYTPIGGISHGITYNAIGYNINDNYIYGINVSGNNNNQLVRIDATGTPTNLGAVTGLPLGGYNSGDMIGEDLYVTNAGSTNIMYKINVSTIAVTQTLTLSQTINSADIAYNRITGLFYGVNNNGVGAANNGRLFTINPSNGAVQFIGTADASIQHPYGAMYSDYYGNTYGNLNTGGFYQFNITNGNRTLLSSSPSALINDGAACTNITFTLGADLEVTKTDASTIYAPGTKVVYTIVAKNNGPYGVANATVTDNVPTGIPTANVTYTAVASSGSNTSVIGTQSGNISDAVSLPVGGTVTYTVNVQVPTTFTGNLVNTATITSPVNSSDPNLANNTATDTDQQGVCYEDPTLVTGGTYPVKHGITILGRAGANNADWPAIRNSAYTALESKTKGLVITRNSSPETNIAIPVVGMTVFDTDENAGAGCIKIYTGSGTGEGWKCFTTQTCP